MSMAANEQAEGSKYRWYNTNNPENFELVLLLLRHQRCVTDLPASRPEDRLAQIYLMGDVDGPCRKFIWGNALNVI